MNISTLYIFLQHNIYLFIIITGFGLGPEFDVYIIHK